MAEKQAMINVRHLSGDEYEVHVRGKHETLHRVRLTESDRQRLGGANVSPEELIKESFAFLLERESNTSILSRFDLPVISRYFPEYEREIRKRLVK
jgi:hypothetical protein